MVAVFKTDDGDACFHADCLIACTSRALVGEESARNNGVNLITRTSRAVTTIRLLAWVGLLTGMRMHATTWWLSSPPDRRGWVYQSPSASGSAIKRQVCVCVIATEIGLLQGHVISNYLFTSGKTHQYIYIFFAFTILSITLPLKLLFLFLFFVLLSVLVTLPLLFNFFALSSLCTLVLQSLLFLVPHRFQIPLLQPSIPEGVGKPLLLQACVILFREGNSVRPVKWQLKWMLECAAAVL